MRSGIGPHETPAPEDTNLADATVLETTGDETFAKGYLFAPGSLHL